MNGIINDFRTRWLEHVYKSATSGKEICSPDTLREEDGNNSATQLADTYAPTLDEEPSIFTIKFPPDIIREDPGPQRKPDSLPGVIWS